QPFSSLSSSLTFLILHPPNPHSPNPLLQPATDQALTPCFLQFTASAVLITPLSSSLLLQPPQSRPRPSKYANCPSPPLYQSQPAPQLSLLHPAVTSHLQLIFPHQQQAILTPTSVATSAMPTT
ncbi:hypothetical protein AMTR_s00445p00013740, partial [Amborella trichopoda]